MLVGGDRLPISSWATFSTHCRFVIVLPFLIFHREEEAWPTHISGNNFIGGQEKTNKQKKRIVAEFFISSRSNNSHCHSLPCKKFDRCNFRFVWRVLHLIEAIDILHVWYPVSKTVKTLWGSSAEVGRQRVSMGRNRRRNILGKCDPLEQFPLSASLERITQDH